ncbi:putative zinc knuckle [Rosellinia necatrix]|uniref:Putative zinc knuckle n=1 Tax=Rosellinia necatrix TaxID=77044 RepID=A0A1S8A824_ROSNE|nr:putative zinc knuckle [Rosellinia necatrix]
MALCRLADAVCYLIDPKVRHDYVRAPIVEEWVRSWREVDELEKQLAHQGPSAALFYFFCQGTDENLSTGIPQRSPLSSILCLFYNADLIDNYNKGDTSATGSLLIYTDGSGIDGHTGAAAECPKIRQTRKAYMGRDTASTVYAGELQGINMALQIAREHRHQGSRWEKATIYTDNQAAIRSSATPVGKSGAYLLRQITRRIL